MGRKAHFEKDHFLDAALKLIARHGPGGVTVASIAKEIDAPIGSVYHRFKSREILLAELWLQLIESFQQEFLNLVNTDDGLNAALHTIKWARRHPDKGRVLLLHRRDELISGKWPRNIKAKTEKLAFKLDNGLRGFAKRLMGNDSEELIYRLEYALMTAPYTIVRNHLQSNTEIPHLAEELVADTFYAILGKYIKEQKGDN